jgi:acyl-CoA thioesterase
VTADLAKDTAVRALGEGAYAADLPHDWSFIAPSGGVLMTAALRAMAAEIGDPAYKPISANTLFCSPVPAGALAIKVEILRRGNAAVQARAALSSLSANEAGLEVSATFGRDRKGFEVLGATPPAVPRPDASRTFEEPFGFAFLANFDQRLALGNMWWEQGWTAGEARFARWLRYRTPQRLADGTLDPLAIPPIADTMPPALRQKLGPDAPFFQAPSLDLTVHFLDPTPREWLLVSCFARRARAGIASAEAEIWDEDGRLVAFATQTMMLRERHTWGQQKP